MIPLANQSLDIHTFIFDCDGVLLNSNRCKSQGFYNVGLNYGLDNAEALLEYHLQNGGVSRFVKFRYFLESVLGLKNVHSSRVEDLCNEYGEIVDNEIMKCEIDSGIHSFRASFPAARWVVASGTEEQQLKRTLLGKGISEYFSDICGSPRDKYQIIRDVLPNVDPRNVVFVGDSVYDYTVAKDCGFTFVLCTQWSEILDIDVWINNNMPDFSVQNLNELELLALKKFQRQ